jgi:hypothetical protein
MSADEKEVIEGQRLDGCELDFAEEITTDEEAESYLSTAPTEQTEEEHEADATR